MTLISLLLACAQALGAIAQWARDRGLINAGQATAIADVLEAQAHEIDIGRAARLAQRAADAGGVSDDGDEFRRD